MGMMKKHLALYAGLAMLGSTTSMYSMDPPTTSRRRSPATQVPKKLRSREERLNDLWVELQKNYELSGSKSEFDVQGFVVYGNSLKAVRKYLRKLLVEHGFFLDMTGEEFLKIVKEVEEQNKNAGK
jgi:hypothetical protein